MTKVRRTERTAKGGPAEHSPGPASQGLHAAGKFAKRQPKEETGQASNTRHRKEVNDKALKNKKEIAR